MRTAEEIEIKIGALWKIRARAEQNDLDIEGVAMADAAIIALKWVLGSDDFDI